MYIDKKVYDALSDDSITFNNDNKFTVRVPISFSEGTKEIDVTYFFGEDDNHEKKLKFKNAIWQPEDGSFWDGIKESNVNLWKAFFDPTYSIFATPYDFEQIDSVSYAAQVSLTRNISGCSLIENNQYTMVDYTNIFYYDPIKHPENKFYKHLLVDRYTEERLNPTENLFKYKIELFSETKKLETIQLPNISITEPLNIDKKKSIWEYLNLYVELYNPIKKYYNGIQTINKFDAETNQAIPTNVWVWEYYPKYHISETLKEVFEDVYSPDFTLNLPNLRDILTRLMQVKDMIPYVIDDVIYGMDITYRDTTPFNTNGITSVISSMTSDNFCNNLKTNYSNALSDENSCNVVEKIGFRNSDKALMKLEDLRIETSYPIYKINNIRMCYYKNIQVFSTDSSSASGVYLCKQNITPFVLLDTTRGLLSQNWAELKELLKSDNISMPDEEVLAKYKMMTIGYNIGSNYITGWGTKYSGIELSDNTNSYYWWKFTATYLENLLVYLDKKYPLGDILKNSIPTSTATYYYSQSDNYDLLSEENDNMVTVAGAKIGEKLKSIFFEIDYTAFYNGTVLHSKDQVLENDITVNDNPSSSLTVLEKEGVFQKSKVNRFGNKVYNITARYNGNEYSSMNKLGQIYQEVVNYPNDTSFVGDDDIIIYHRDYSIYDNYIAANYTGSKNAVLKNYFHSVFAKHRTWNLMSYNESVNRAENERLLLIFSKQISYLEPFNKIQFLCFENDYIKQLFNFFETTPRKLEKTQDKTYVNFSALVRKTGDFASFFLCDFNSFVTGTSLCFNVKMRDNISFGNYIDELSPAISFVATSQEIKEDYIGTSQNIYSAIDDKDTGFTKNLGFMFGKLNNTLYSYSLTGHDTINNVYKEYLLKLPQLNFVVSVGETESEFKDSIYFSESEPLFSKHFKDAIYFEKNVNKDNKEIIDMTFQIEALSQDENVVISPWMLKLSDFYNKYNKTNKSYYAIDYLLKQNNVYLYLKNDIGGSVKNSNGKGYEAFSLLEIYVPADLSNYLAGKTKNLLPDEYLFFAYDFSGYQGALINLENITKDSWINKKSYFYIQKITFDSAMNYIDTVGYAKYILGHIKFFGGKWNDEKDGDTIENQNIRFTKVSNDPVDGYYIYRAYNINSNIELGGYVGTIEVSNSSYYFNNRCPDNYAEDKRGSINAITNLWIPESDSPVYVATRFDFNINDDVPKYYPYPKNLFLGVYDHKINKNFVYNSYKNSEGLGLQPNIDISDIINFEFDEDVPCLKIDLSSFSSKPESLVVWYYVNEDSAKEYYQLKNITGRITKTVSYGSDYITSEQPAEGERFYGFWVNKISVYYVSAMLSVANIQAIEYVNVDKVFNVLNRAEEYQVAQIDYFGDNTNAIGKGFTVTVLSSSQLSLVSITFTANTNNTKLINGAYNFVFGANVSDADWANKEITIYYSLLTNKDPRIYDAKNQLVGTLINYADETKRMNIPYFLDQKICMPANYVYTLHRPKNLVISDNYVLSWDIVEGAASYKIICRDSSGQNIINEEVTDNELDLKEVLTDYFTNGTLISDVFLDTVIYVKALSDDHTRYEDSSASSITLRINIAE